MVNQAFVRRYLAGVDPIGVRIGEGSGPDVQTNTVIVGVVTDFSYRNLRDDVEQVLFSIFEGEDEYDTVFYVKVRGTPDQAFQAIRTIVRAADPQLPILGFRTLDDQVNRSLNTERMLAAISGAFGVLALLLSLTGLYGVMSFVVARRTREIGLRLALGATGGSAVRLILQDAVTMIAAGVALALPCVVVLGQFLRSQLFGIAATDVRTVAAAAVLLTAGGLVAAFIPAWRASNVSPTDALRLE
jgi:ABC-type antimicrobial peptide transport system permease subunit